VGYPKEANAGIFVKRLNRRKFRPGATSFLAMGSSLYIAGVEVFAEKGGIYPAVQISAKITIVSADQAGVWQNKLQQAVKAP
jgi:hypothetical protein